MLRSNKRQLFLLGLKDGVPIGLGYFAVAFSLGITASRAGFNFIQGFIASALLNASAGEYALFNCVLEGALLTEVVLITIVANARYLLMSCALSQKVNPNLKLYHRLLMSFFITDEFFGISVSRKDYAEPYYIYGAIAFASPCWAVGTMLGILIGQILPPVLVSALSVSLYGMFLAVIIPASKGNKVVLGTVACSFALSYIVSIIPWFDVVSDSMKIIVLTVAISTVVALLFPRNDDEKKKEETKTEIEKTEIEINGGKDNA